MTPYDLHTQEREAERVRRDEFDSYQRHKGIDAVAPNKHSWTALRGELDWWIGTCEMKAALFAGSDLGVVYLRLLEGMRKEQEACKQN